MQITNIYYMRNARTNNQYKESHRYTHHWDRAVWCKYCPNCGQENSVWHECVYEDAETHICINCGIVFQASSNDYAYVIDDVISSEDDIVDTTKQNFIQLRGGECPTLEQLLKNA